MRPQRPADWAVANISRGIYVDGHWYSDREVALSAMWWGRFVYPGEAMTLMPIRLAGASANPAR